MTNFSIKIFHVFFGRIILLGLRVCFYTVFGFTSLTIAENISLSEDFLIYLSGIDQVNDSSPNNQNKETDQNRNQSHGETYFEDDWSSADLEFLWLLMGADSEGVDNQIKNDSAMEIDSVKGNDQDKLQIQKHGNRSQSNE